MAMAGDGGGGGGGGAGAKVAATKRKALKLRGMMTETSEVDLPMTHHHAWPIYK